MMTHTRWARKNKITYDEDDDGGVCDDGDDGAYGGGVCDDGDAVVDGVAGRR